MEETEELRAARALRRAMLGDAYVDRTAATATDKTGVEFQDYITTVAWGVWARGGPLSPRDRSLLVMAMTAALGRMEEFHLHASSSPQTGVTDEEIDELVFQIAAYCGAPAGISARRTIQSIRTKQAPNTPPPNNGPPTHKAPSANKGSSVHEGSPPHEASPTHKAPPTRQVSSAHQASPVHEGPPAHKASPAHEASSAHKEET